MTVEIQSDRNSAESTEMDTLMTNRIGSNEATQGDSDFPTVSTDASLHKRRQGSSCSSQKCLLSLILLLSLVCLCIGIVLVIMANGKCKKGKDLDGTDNEASSAPSQICAPSEQAKAIKLQEFLDKVQAKYFKLHPNAVAWKPGASREEMRKTFRPFDPSPQKIKIRTDAAFHLLEEIKNITVQENTITSLKPREKKLVAQMKFFLNTNFGQPYDGNYYSGDWMMGPNFFCFQPVCNVGMELSTYIPILKPSSLDDVKRLEEILKLYKKSITQFTENIKLGVKSGMVRSVEECETGLNAFKGTFPMIAQHNETGILKESFLKVALQPEYLNSLSNETIEILKSQTGKDVPQIVKDTLVANVGVPLKALIRYLEGEYASHCVPSSVSSGLANRPLRYVYTNGVRDTSRRTSQTLPTGERLDGKKTYAGMISYFTDTDITASYVYEKGWEILNATYPQVIEIAKEFTGLDNTSAAVTSFRHKLTEQDMYFNAESFPKNESSSEAFRRCSSDEGAKKYCPKRWEALQKWFKTSREVMSLLDPKTVNMFHFTGEQQTTPGCPVSLIADFMPTSAAQSYVNSDSSCSSNCFYRIPFFLENMGPKFSEWSVNAHEARPGHHTQAQGFLEHFTDSCGGVGDWLGRMTSFQAFSEGWALYAEALIGEETDTYQGRPLMKYGWLKWQIWRALRLIIDTGLHSKGLTREQGLELFDRYAWDNTDISRKELSRYQSGPGQATAYLIGKLVISKLKTFAKEQLGEKFDQKEFHYQLLSQGSSPLSFLEEHIKEYIKCKKSPKRSPACNFILRPTRSSIYTTLNSHQLHQQAFYSLPHLQWKRYL
ncbi:uncharacterized protein LOC5517661 [Nematostella vectensis]|uniref:uncharacterized protein LOC5517661 n=1 Tax=Nematostella vectensis TaxID=45351 RepID=UPI002077390D|nr:uncharacterized protein LOC5517661 [Nematostella vectensis]XP_048583999.1 uncharacterized protein LOC5517661 [Nematostella vectensis]